MSSDKFEDDPFLYGDLTAMSARPVLRFDAFYLTMAKFSGNL